VQRAYVHRSLHDEFVATLAEKVAALRVGDPMDPATNVSALINPKETERVAGWLDEAVAEGAGIVTGGDRAEHGVLRPTLVDAVTPSMRISHTEVFGPVVGVTPYDSFDDAVTMANDTRYGLQAAVFTSDITTALSAAARLDFGGVLVNEVPTWRADQQP
jgi:acyl-CoA reductase-like NAD-dependent aldehyde dehydrogenase